MNGLIIALLIVERIAIAVVGLLAAIYGQVGWSIFMGAILMTLLAGTEISVKGKKTKGRR